MTANGPSVLGTHLYKSRAIPYKFLFDTFGHAKNKCKITP